MTDRTILALEEMARRGGTPAERATARQKLAAIRARQQAEKPGKQQQEAPKRTQTYYKTDAGSNEKESVVAVRRAFGWWEYPDGSLYFG